jgi:Collagen triple helix repeat (20 copies)
MLHHVNRSGALAVVALLAALAGSSYAAGAVLLPSASVGSPQLKGSVVTAAKIATGAATTSAVRDGTLLRGDLAPAAAAGPAGAAGAAGRTGAPGARGASGTAGPTGLTGARGPAGIAGAKGASGDQGSAPPPSYFSVGTLGNVFVGANDESTGTISCPPGMRVLSGGPSGVPTGPGPPRLTVVTSEPDPAGTGWIVTMRAGAREEDFQVEAICALVD